MTKNELLTRINSEQTDKIFKELYGEDEINHARKRYAKLLKQEGFPEAELANSIEEYRFFSAPGRTELAGNHTDHNRGKVLAASIQTDCAALVQKRTDNIVFFRSTGFPDVKLKLTDEKGESGLKPKPQFGGFS